MGLHFRSIHRQRAELRDARFTGNLHHLHEQRLEGRQVVLAKLSDRSVRREIPAANTRYATSSSNVRAMRRDEKVPVAYAYSSTVTIIWGSNG
jgi:hypothetical protein